MELNRPIEATGSLLVEEKVRMRLVVWVLSGSVSRDCVLASSALSPFNFERKSPARSIICRRTIARSLARLGLRKLAIVRARSASKWRGGTGGCERSSSGAGRSKSGLQVVAQPPLRQIALLPSLQGGVMSACVCVCVSVCMWYKLASGHTGNEWRLKRPPVSPWTHIMKIYNEKKRAREREGTFNMIYI